ncbi:DUF72 domain-containing protein [Pedobacter sp. SYP-B3415]|uniref:DUF72 domain-containing protein n=1 Tax=Pedobacter sp. SYP-B3415 TaxID=2496641 RepID=UPI00101BCAF6|nr:DUF72 domain-containing protein [Pedobacter sp. SYP-B3415]
MKAGSVYIGTSGWSYKHWRGSFYPEKLAARRHLTYYAERYNAVELNTSFYRIPLPGTIEKWMTEFPPGFKICPKMSRFLSHMKKLNDPEEPLERFFGVIDRMAEFTGPVLIQLPDNLSFKPETVERFYGILEKRYSAYRFAMEVRHPSWFSAESISMMKTSGVTLVIAQSGLYPYHEEVTAKDIYLRFHGPSKLYDSSYSKKTLGGYAEKIHSWQQDGHQVWAFFNNDIHTYAIKNADTLKKLLSKK